MYSIIPDADTAFPAIAPDLILKVRALLSPIADSKCSDADVRRFIRAETKGKVPAPNVELSAKRLEETVAWRMKEKPEDRICRLCTTSPHLHYMHPIGIDKKGRPVVYSCFKMGMDKELDSNTDHMLSTFESLVRLMENQENRWVTLIDFHGFTMRDALNTKISKAFSHISGTYYPERLGESYLLDAPSIFSVLWSAISLMVDKKTQEKVRFVPYVEKKLRESLSSIMDEALVEWILKEMAENRDKAKSKAKRYEPMRIYELAFEGKLVEDGKRLDLGGAHCCFGSPALLALYQNDPSLLLPQCSKISIV